MAASLQVDPRLAAAVFVAPGNDEGLREWRDAHDEQVQFILPAVKPLGHDCVGPYMPPTKWREGVERAQPQGVDNLGLVRERDHAGRRPIGIDIVEQVTGSRDQLVGRLVQKRRHEQESAVVEPKLTPRLDDAALAEDHILPASGQGSADGGPFFEGNRHA